MSGGVCITCIFVWASYKIAPVIPMIYCRNYITVSNSLVE